jgi:hypothetical protein
MLQIEPGRSDALNAQMDALRTKERQALRKRQYEEWQQSEQSALGSPRLRPVHPLASAAGSDHKIENEGDVTPPHSRQVSPLNRPHTSPSSPGMVKLTEEEQAAQTGLFIYEEEYQSCGRGRVPVTPAPAVGAAESPPSSARKSIGLTRIEMTARLMPVDFNRVCCHKNAPVWSLFIHISCRCTVYYFNIRSMTRRPGKSCMVPVTATFFSLTQQFRPA